MGRDRRGSPAEARRRGWCFFARPHTREDLRPESLALGHPGRQERKRRRELLHDRRNAGRRRCPGYARGALARRSAIRRDGELRIRAGRRSRGCGDVAFRLPRRAHPQSHALRLPDPGDQGRGDRRALGARARGRADAGCLLHARRAFRLRRRLPPRSWRSGRPALSPDGASSSNRRPSSPPWPSSSLSWA